MAKGTAQGQTTGDAADAADAAANTADAGTGDAGDAADAADAAADTADAGAANLGDAGKAAIARERAAARQAKQERDAALARLKEFEDANKSEAEKLREKNADYERQILERDQREQETRLRLASVTAAAKLGFTDPEDGVRFLDAAAVEYDDAGQPNNVQSLLSGVLEQRPYLRSSRSRAGGEADFGNQGKPATFSREKLAGMKPEEINAHWDEIVAAAKAGALK